MAEILQPVNSAKEATLKRKLAAWALCSITMAKKEHFRGLPPEFISQLEEYQDGILDSCATGGRI